VLGKTISHYKVLEKIGQGGMGEVYLAEDNRLVALRSPMPIRNQKSRGGEIAIFFCLIFLLASPFSLMAGLPKEAKKRIEAKYQKTKLFSTWKTTVSNFREELNSALVVIQDRVIPAVTDHGFLLVRQPDTSFDLDIRDGKIVRFDEYHQLLPLGTIMGIYDVKFKDDRVELFCRTASPRQLEIFGGHYLNTKLRFYFNDRTMKSGDIETIFAAIDQWVKPFSSLEEAEQFAENLVNPAAQEIRLGLTMAEIQAVLGEPDTKIDLGDRVVYRYPDMAVEFIDGKVAEVKF